MHVTEWYCRALKMAEHYALGCEGTTRDVKEATVQSKSVTDDPFCLSQQHVAACRIMQHTATVQSKSVHEDTCSLPISRPRFAAHRQHTRHTATHSNTQQHASSCSTSARLEGDLKLPVLHVALHLARRFAGLLLCGAWSFSLLGFALLLAIILLPAPTHMDMALAIGPSRACPLSTNRASPNVADCLWGKVKNACNHHAPPCGHLIHFARPARLLGAQGVDAQKLVA
mmetsp:Transcript_74587/g.121184  ORF Transcript_74587/g.121184 Transcript_74587/m.121184 type:complete len:228 (-) Transcript_74587:795-1478(-)